MRKVFAAVLAVFMASAPGLAQPVTIAALGDSLTQGYGLPAEDGLVPQLQTWLNDHGTEAVLINAGVSGDTTAGGLSRIGWTLTGEVDALIVALGGNDLLRGLPPSASRANLEGILQTATEKGLPVLLIGLPAPANYGPDYKAAFDAIYPELAAEYGALVLPDFMAALRPYQDQPGAFARLMQADGLHPSADGVALIVEDIGPKVAELAARARN